MYRIVIVPYATGALTEAETAHVCINNGRTNQRGYYVYAYPTLREVREVGMQMSRGYANGCSIFVLDDEAGMIVDEARHPKRPQLAWKNMESTPASGKAATAKGAKGKKAAKS